MTFLPTNILRVSWCPFKNQLSTLTAKEQHVERSLLSLQTSLFVCHHSNQASVLVKSDAVIVCPLRLSYWYLRCPECWDAHMMGIYVETLPPAAAACTALLCEYYLQWLTLPSPCACSPAATEWTLDPETDGFASPSPFLLCYPHLLFRFKAEGDPGCVCPCTQPVSLGLYMKAIASPEVIVFSNYVSLFPPSFQFFHLFFSLPPNDPDCSWPRRLYFSWSVSAMLRYSNLMCAEPRYMYSSDNNVCIWFTQANHRSNMLIFPVCRWLYLFTERRLTSPRSIDQIPLLL